MTRRAPLIFNADNWEGPQPRTFFGSHFGERLRWENINTEPPGVWSWLHKLPKPVFCRLKGGMDLGLAAVREQAALVISHGPRNSFYCELFLKLLRYRGSHLAFTFNFPHLPVGVRLKLMRSAFSSIEHFIVYSQVERQIYHDAFRIPLEKLEFIHWGVRPPIVTSPDRALISGDYVCALGGNARDYSTLIAAMKSLPEIQLVLVARPQNLVGLDIPANVQARTNIPLGDAMNILAHSRFMVLPLLGSDVPCGHVTLVNAMYLAKAYVISNSLGVADYVEHGVNSLTCEAFSPDALAAAIRQLWLDPDYCRRLGIAGKAFVEQHCTEASTLAWLTGYLKNKGLIEG